MENGAFLGEDYFERLLAEIREIRLSERKFYQKITDIYATAIDYNKVAPTTQIFFAKVQKKQHFAIHDHTAAELIVQLRKIHQQAEITGLFIGDRELLDCTHCGLQEDVLIDGRLVTYQADAADAADSGLRFAAADEGNFVCPQCGAVIAGEFFV